MFMHIKAPDENVLTQLIPEVWWDTKVRCLVYDVCVGDSVKNSGSKRVNPLQSHCTTPHLFSQLGRCHCTNTPVYLPAVDIHIHCHCVFFFFLLAFV